MDRHSEVVSKALVNITTKLEMISLDDLPLLRLVDQSGDVFDRMTFNFLKKTKWQHC